MAMRDSPEVLRAKRRWVQQEFDTRRISGKVTRELHDLYHKKNLGKVQQQHHLAHNLSDAAQAAKQRLEEAFEQSSGARPVARVVGQTLGNSPSNQCMIPSATRFILDGFHTDNHQALGEQIDSQVVDNPPDDEAGDLVGEVDVKSKDGTETETEHESSSDEDSLFISTRQARIVLANPAEDNDAAARQRILDLGLELADADRTEAFDGMQGGGEMRIKEEEADE